MKAKQSGKSCSLVAAIFGCLLLAGCDSAPEAPPVSDSWVRIAANGSVVSEPESELHHCVLDERTGLMWEVKREAPGLHFHGNTYSWHSTDKQRHMSDPGRPDGGDCSASSCDSQGLVEAVNEAGLCGFRDWYMPVRNELMTLGDSNLVDSGLAVDTAFFPHVVAGEYWTAETFRMYPQSAWAVDTRHGLDRADLKTEPKPVRVVRRHQDPRGEEE